MSILLIACVILLIIVIIIFVGYYFSIYNSLVRLRNNIDKAWSNIDVLLKQRHDELTKLLKTVKGYMKYEKDLLQRITEARSVYMNARSVGEKANADNMISGALKTLFAVAENYPDLKANQNFMQLQEELTTTENKIAYARQFYNDSVMKYDTSRQTFPNSAVASMFHFVDRDYFEVEEAAKAVPKVDFTRKE